MSDNKVSIKSVLPALTGELKELLKRSNKPDLAGNVNSLVIFEKCGCGEKSCASFYTAPKPDGNFGAGHENIMLDADRGMIVLDIVDDKIRFIEILDRPEYKQIIDQI